MTLSRTQVDNWAGACLAVGNEVADTNGFVAVRSLLSRFDAELMLRPLLVEAMLCEATESRDPLAGAARWRLLVDSERYAFQPEAIAEETATAPLPSRLRNTVAHELTHSLAFRAKEFGVDLTLPIARGKQKASDIVDDVERYTEELSPLLLAPDRAIDRWFPSTLDKLRADNLTATRLAMGVSRFVLIQRLNLMRAYGNGLFIERRCFGNVAVGIGSWTREGGAMLKGRPVFARFDRNEAPAFIHTLHRVKTLPVSAVTDDPSFVLNGGETNSLTLEVPAGTEKNPERTTLLVELSVENTRRRLGGSFFFVATGLNR